MSILTMKKQKDGSVTLPKQLGLFDTLLAQGKSNPTDKDIVLRISAHTELWSMIYAVKSTMPKYPATRAARVLIRAGYLEFVRAMERQQNERD